MPGTADNFVAEKVLIGPGKMYVDLGGGSGQWDGGAGVRLILDDDGSPDSTQNPSAIHLGYTEGGTEWLVKPTVQNFFADEEVDPIVARVTEEEKVISGSMLQILNMDLAEVMIPTALRSDVMGSQGLTFGGSGVIGYTSVAVIAPLESDATRFAVFHLYKAFNDAGLAAQITAKKLSASPFAFRGLGIGTRAAGDKAGRYYVQNAGAQS